MKFRTSVAQKTTWFLLFSGEACEISGREMDYDSKRITELSNRLVNGITSQVLQNVFLPKFVQIPLNLVTFPYCLQLSNVVFNGDPDNTYPGCINLSFAFVEGESLLMALKVSLETRVLNHVVRFMKSFKKSFCNML